MSIWCATAVPRAKSSLAFLADYGVRAFLVAQSLHQINRGYGHKHGQTIVVALADPTVIVLMVNPDGRL
jgi:type IV secretory pathway TraG/TraD family ATPase VirD4